MIEREPYIPVGYAALTETERALIINGCGSANAKFDFVPDRIWGLKIRKACDIHDYMYAVADATLKDKEDADTAFLHNLLVLIERRTRSRLLLWLRRSRARKYYLAVKYFGGPAFWAGKKEEAHGRRSS